MYTTCASNMRKKKMPEQKEDRTAYSQWDETEYAIKHKTRYEREREAYE